MWALDLRAVHPTSWRKGPPLGIPGLENQMQVEPEYQGFSFETASPVIASARYIARDNEGRWFVVKADDDGRLWAGAPDYEVLIESLSAQRQ